MLRSETHLALNALMGETNGFTAYLAPLHFTDQLKNELSDIVAAFDRLIVTRNNGQNSYWAQNIWYDAKIFSIVSITDAVKKLRALGPRWHSFSYTQHRRAHLIQEQLPHINWEPITFGAPWPKKSLGSWCLLDHSTVIASNKCSSPFPHGEITFVENKKDPPSRAYLKLWEVFTRLEMSPQPNQLCVDLGASPGGWTWVLTGLGAKVIAIDRSSLTPALMQHPLVDFKKGNAFSLSPSDISGPIDWMFSDVICYPEKLWEFVEKWLASGKCKNFVFTIKFQGTGSYGILNNFSSVPGTKIMHLCANKHELTWVRVLP